MPTETKRAIAAAAALPTIPMELIDQFGTGPISAEAVNAASMAFKKALIERAALGAELTPTWATQGGCRARCVGNNRNGASVFTVERHIRGKCTCTRCRTLTQASVPAEVIDKGIPTAGLLAQVLVAKHADYLPPPTGSTTCNKPIGLVIWPRICFILEPVVRRSFMPSEAIFSHTTGSVHFAIYPDGFDGARIIARIDEEALHDHFKARSGERELVLAYANNANSIDAKAEACYRANPAQPIRLKRDDF